MLDAIHNSQKLHYKNPFGAVECESKIDIKININKRHEVSSVVLNLSTDNGSNREIELQKSDSEDAYYSYSNTVEMPKEIGLYWYNFTIKIEDKIFYYGNNSSMMGGEGAVYDSNPPSYQITVYKKENTTVDWIKDGIMYQIFPDRFFNGNDDGKVNRPNRDMLLRSKWLDIPRYIKDEAGRVDYFDYFGGNLLGIINKLDYLKELGVSVIYLNPIFEAGSNHKYDTGDYKKIDPMFGNEEIFINLCEKAKAKGIKIILDGVFSHTGDDSVYFNRYGRYDSLGAYQSKDSPYYSWYRFEEYPERYESWWGVDALPNVDELDQGYLNYMINDKDSVVNKWSSLGISGWRLDVADELPDEFIKRFKAALKKADPDSVLIGEVWEDASNKLSYGERRTYLLGEELDSTMNYPFRDTFVDFLLGRIDSRDARLEMMKIYENYPLHHFYSLMNLIGTHDIPRILTILGESPDENGLSQYEKEKFKLEDEKLQLAIKRLKLLTLIQMTFPGIPSIYYGDEAGLEGYTDPINRKTYPWGEENKEILEWYKKITKIRSKHDVLKTGTFEILDLEGDIFGYIRRTKASKDVFNRNCDENTAIILANRSDREISLSIDLNNSGIENLYSILDNKLVETNTGILKLKLSSFESALLLKNQ